MSMTSNLASTPNPWAIHADAGIRDERGLIQGWIVSGVDERSRQFQLRLTGTSQKKSVGIADIDPKFFIFSAPQLVEPHPLTSAEYFAKFAEVSC